MNPFPGRIESLARSLGEDQVDAFLVTDPVNVRYLSGFSGEDAALLVFGDRPILLSDGRFTTQIEQECPGLEAAIREVGQTPIAFVADSISKLGARRVAFEAANLSVADHLTLLENVATVDWFGAVGRVEALRAIKDEGEIEAIREAIGFAERAFLKLRSGLKPGDSEKDVADDLESHLRREGASAASFPPIVAVGPRAALPHARPTAEARLGASDFVLIDWGATGSPYKSDLTRVLVTGKVTPKFEAIYRTVLKAQERGIAAIRPGALAKDVDAEARSVIEEAGFGRFFSHGLGHGLGIEVHEAPRLRKGADEPLRAGMVVTIEPGIYMPDWGGVRIEDDILVTPDGHEVLSRLPRDLETALLD